LGRKRDVLEKELPLRKGSYRGKNLQKREVGKNREKGCKAFICSSSSKKKKKVDLSQNSAVILQAEGGGKREKNFNEGEEGVYLG